MVAPCGSGRIYKGVTYVRQCRQLPTYHFVKKKRKKKELPIPLKYCFVLNSCVSSSF